MNNKEKNFISAVIYVRNAENRLFEFLNAVIGVLEGNFENTEIICVNDASTDNSVSIIKEIAEKSSIKNITLVNMSYYQGLESAMNAGLDLAIGDYIIEFDGTVLDFDPGLIMQTYRRMLGGADIVSVTCDKPQKLHTRMFYKIFNRFSKSPNKIFTETFRILSRRALNRIQAMNLMVPYRKPLYAMAGLKTDNIIYTCESSVLKQKDLQEREYKADLAVESLILFTGIGYKISFAMTLIMMVISIAMFVYAIVIYFNARPIAGWTTTVLFLSVCFFGLFIIQTFIMKYLQTIINLIFKKKAYCFENVEKLNN